MFMFRVFFLPGLPSSIQWGDLTFVSWESTNMCRSKIRPDDSFHLVSVLFKPGNTRTCEGTIPKRSFAVAVRLYRPFSKKDIWLSFIPALVLLLFEICCGRNAPLLDHLPRFVACKSNWLGARTESRIQTLRFYSSFGGNELLVCIPQVIL